MARKKITKNMIKGLLNLNHQELGSYYEDIINDINLGIEVDYLRFVDGDYKREYNRALRDVFIALLFANSSYQNGNKAQEWNARAKMIDVMYTYNIATSNTSEQNLRGLDCSCYSYSPQAFKFTACLNMGLDHYDIEIK